MQLPLQLRIWRFKKQERSQWCFDRAQVGRCDPLKDSIFELHGFLAVKNRRNNRQSGVDASESMGGVSHFLWLGPPKRSLRSAEARESPALSKDMVTRETVHTQTIDIVLITMLVAITSGSMKHWGNEIANIQPKAVVISCTYLSNNRCVTHWKALLSCICKQCGANRCDKNHCSDHLPVLMDLLFRVHSTSASNEIHASFKSARSRAKCWK